MDSLSTNRKITTALVYLVLAAGAVLMIFPFVWMLLTSFKSMAESMRIPPTILPAQWLIQNYTDALLCGGLFLRSGICLCEA